MVVPKINNDLKSEDYFEKLLTIVIDVSQLLMSNGEEVRLVEDTARNISLHYGAKSISFNATPMEISLLIVSPEGKRFFV